MNVHTEYLLKVLRVCYSGWHLSPIEDCQTLGQSEVQKWSQP